MATNGQGQGRPPQGGGNEGAGQRPAQQQPRTQQAPQPASTGEQARGSATQQPPPAAESKALTIFRDPNKIQGRLVAARQNYNVLMPQSHLDFIPEGYAVSVRTVRIDPDKDHGDVYPIPGAGGKVALSKVALDKLSAAGGINWYPTRRLDDGSDPRYCHVEVVGVYQEFDGSARVISATKELDLRDGSPTCLELERIAAKKQRSADDQISQMRMHILSHAESKARNRAIRMAFAIRSSYSPDEVARPFIIPKLVFTGESEDPELRREFAKMRAQQAMIASGILYGGAPGGGGIQQPPRPLPEQPEPRMLNAPPVGAVPADPEDFGSDEPGPAIDGEFSEASEPDSGAGQSGAGW